MSLKYKSRRKSSSKQQITKRNKHYTHSKKHRVLNKHNHSLHNLHAIQNNIEHDGREKVAFDTKHEHFDKVNLILSNLENKKHGKDGNNKSNYRNYRRWFN